MLSYMVGRAVARPAPTPEPDVAVARNRPAGEIAPRRGNVHDVGRTVTHERITCWTVLRGSWQTAVVEGYPLIRFSSAAPVNKYEVGFRCAKDFESI